MKIFFTFLTLVYLGGALHAANGDKLQLLYMQMKHCPWCHKMNEEIFDNPEIVSKLRMMYTIRKKYRGDKELPAFVQPRFYPTTYILSADGKKLLDELPGYMEPQHFLEYLTELYELEHHPG